MEINRVINGDSIMAMKNMEPECVDLIVTDPPYKTITGGDSDGKYSKRPQGMLAGNRNIFKYQNVKISDWMSEIFRILKNGSHCYIFTNTLNLGEMLNESLKVGFKLHNVLCWEKNNCTPSQYYMKNCEYVLFLRKGKAKWINNIGGSKTVHQFDNIHGKKTHPCEKPVELMEFYISNSSDAGDLVFDPFAGTGSTLVAAQHLNRKYLGYELEYRYCAIADWRLGDNYLQDKLENKMANKRMEMMGGERMGATCKPIGDFKSVMKKMENKLEEERKTQKGKKKGGE